MIKTKTGVAVAAALLIFGGVAIAAGGGAGGAGGAGSGGAGTGGGGSGSGSDGMGPGTGGPGTGTGSSETGSGIGGPGRRPAARGLAWARGPAEPVRRPAAPAEQATPGVRGRKHPAFTDRSAAQAALSARRRPALESALSLDAESWRSSTSKSRCVPAARVHRSSAT
jgi:hypothetical protein